MDNIEVACFRNIFDGREESKLSSLYKEFDDIFRFSHSPAGDENSRALNALFFAGVPVLSDGRGSRHSVAELGAVLQASELVGKCPSAVLAALPSLVGDDVAREKASGGVSRLLSQEHPLLKFIYHEQQRAGLCLVHALNNIFGARLFTSVASDADVVDGCYNVWSLARKSGDGPLGQYSDDAIAPCCARLGIEAILVPVNGMELSELRAVWSDVNRHPAFLGGILLRRSHFISLTRTSKGEAGFMVLDSRDKAPRTWQTGDLIPNFLKRMDNLHVLISVNASPPIPALRRAQRAAPQGQQLARRIGERLWGK